MRQKLIGQSNKIRIKTGGNGNAEWLVKAKIEEQRRAGYVKLANRMAG
jgi:hypothetical protein